MVRRAEIADAAMIGRLLFDFNTEFDEPTPSPEELTARMAELLAGGDTVVLLAGDGPDGVAVLRFRLAIWSKGSECYLAEMYVVPERRRQGLGRALLEAAIATAKERGADTMDIGVDEPDVGARALYEGFGFTNRTGEPPGDLMFVYERELSAGAAEEGGSEHVDE
jgi:GNAT superfamily N-acetyltransferase